MNEQQLHNLEKGASVVYRSEVGIVQNISHDTISILIGNDEQKEVDKEHFAYLFPLTTPDIQRESSWFLTRRDKGIAFCFKCLNQQRKCSNHICA